MKNFIITLAILLAFATLIVFQTDSNNLATEKEKLKYVCEDASNAATLNINTESFGNGYLVYDYDKANEDLFNIIKLKLSLDQTNIPARYYTAPISYSVYYFDDTLVQKTYINGVKQDNKEFRYGDEWTEPVTGKVIRIEDPMAIVTISAGAPKMRLAFLANKVTVSESSAYEYKTD